MLKLHQYIIINFLSIFSVIIIISSIVSYFSLNNISISQHKQSIKTNIEMLKIELPNVINLNKFVLKVKEKTAHRLTIMDDDGLVIAESDIALNKMENHSDREEIRISRAQVDGYAIRHSATLDKDFLYLASQFDLNGKPVFIRLSKELSSITNEFNEIWIRMLIIFTISLIAGLYAIYHQSKKIEKEIDKITYTLDEISNKNYKTAVNSSFASEFFKIESHINHLSNKLEKRAKQKRKYTAKIKLISKQRSDIISAISHEFKNPIASVMGYAQTLLEDKDTNEQIRKRFLGKIIKNSQKISFMIDRLALATKLENGDLDPQKTKFDLYTLTNEVVDTFKDKNPNRIFNFIGQNHSTYADKTMIEMVIINLIENALKYSEDEIIIELNNGALHVRDKGIGITANEIDQVTNKFYRSNTRSWDNSIGLGLSIVKYILNLHDSQLHIQSEKEKGSDISFTLS